MIKERFFNVSLAFSFFVHAIALSPAIFFPNSLKDKTLKTIHVTYVRTKPQNIIIDKKLTQNSKSEDLDKIRLTERIVLSSENKIPQRKKIAQVENYGQKELIAKAKETLQKPRPFKTEFLPRNDIKLSVIESSKSQNPVYLNYQNFIRENFRRYLYNKYSDTLERGEIYLTFILNADGTVKDAQIIDAKSQASDRLKKLVLEGLYDVAPFPQLPESLNSPLLSFSVTVIFKERESD